MCEVDNEFYGTASSADTKIIYNNATSDFQNVSRFLLGRGNSFHYLNDPKRVGFLLARYKFVAKMLVGKENVLEIGCQEGLGTVLVAKEVKHVHAIDFFKEHVDHCLTQVKPLVGNIDFQGWDILDGAPVVDYDGAFSLDVFEHISPDKEDTFFASVVNTLSPNGVFIMGIPSLESQKYASSGSKAGHVNCKNGEQLRSLCLEYFNNVFLFGMNDEVLHTGFLPMSQYLLAVCAGPRDMLH